MRAVSSATSGGEKSKSMQNCKGTCVLIFCDCLRFDLFLAVLVDSRAPGWQPVGGGQQALHLPQGPLLEHHPPVARDHKLRFQFRNHFPFSSTCSSAQPPEWNGPDDDEIFSRSNKRTILQRTQIISNWLKDGNSFVHDMNMIFTLISNAY